VSRTLLDRPDRPTAVLCFSDAYAVGVMNVARSLGLRVPEDLSIVGYDDSPVAVAARPQLTTVHQEVASKGHEAVRALMTAMGRTKVTVPERIMLPTSLVVRESTAPPA
jgi:DNA-binding LacI/PurR family transcriptional regulator